MSVICYSSILGKKWIHIYRDVFQTNAYSRLPILHWNQQTKRRPILLVFISFIFLYVIHICFYFVYLSFFKYNRVYYILKIDGKNETIVNALLWILAKLAVMHLKI